MTSVPLNLVRNAVTSALHPAHFFVGLDAALEWQHEAHEEISWEIFRGRLLDASQTRLRQSFEAWNLFWGDAAGRSVQPILAVKLDVANRMLHIVRSIHCYAWEGYHAGDNVYASREVRKWLRELVGSIHLDRVGSVSNLQEELRCLLFQAVVGSSRLPITSIEAPLPAFSLGELAYFGRMEAEELPAESGPMRSYDQLIDRVLTQSLSETETARLLETVLRSIPDQEVRFGASLFRERWRQLRFEGTHLAKVSRRLFNEVALSPYTGFVDNLLHFLAVQAEEGLSTREEVADLLSYFLRQTARHLTAYDLVTFHHQGANYPDALMLDSLLRAYLQFIESEPVLFHSEPHDDPALQKKKRIRRRGLRQGWLMWHLLKGLPVPDAPTSPGENARIVPGAHLRVPEEQIQVAGKRTRRLYLDQSLPMHDLLMESIDDLHQPEELQELGMAVFLDRPLGTGKAPGEPDRTLLLSYEAYSRSIAERRLRFLAGDLNLLPGQLHEIHRLSLSRKTGIAGIAIPAGRTVERPGVISLQDALKVADDFLLLRTTRQTQQHFFDQFEFAALGDSSKLDLTIAGPRLLIVRGGSEDNGTAEIVTVYDERLQRRLELQVDPSLGYELRRGEEYPRAGLIGLRVWERRGDRGELEETTLGQLRIRPQRRSEVADRG
ncbi:MAG TPA: hypothetical protein VK395_09530 [Gemmataceae bacterium]|nr:hypothetical protein [Gemmataceae bacterium]